MSYNCIEDKFRKMEDPTIHGYEAGIKDRLYYLSFREYQVYINIYYSI